jgi:hypothetical protein
MGRLVTSPEEILRRLTPRRLRKYALSTSKGVDMNSMPRLAQCAQRVSCAAGESSSAASIACWLDAPPSARCWYSAVGAVRVTRPSAVKVWNFTASAPAAAATSTSARARPRSPLWLTPASAMTKVRLIIGPL